MTDDAKYPAEFVVHWPGQSVAMCDEHRQAANRVAAAMGMPEPTATPVPETGEVTECGNCLNLAKKAAR